MTKESFKVLGWVREKERIAIRSIPVVENTQSKTEANNKKRRILKIMNEEVISNIVRVQLRVDAVASSVALLH